MIPRGIPTIANTGQGLGSSQNGGILSNCDAVDIDDDDDGILDEVECPITSDLNYATYGNNSGTNDFPGNIS